jgi:hypothetical protein
MEGGYIFPLRFTPEHFTQQKDCTLKELFQVYQYEYVLQEYACKKCSVQSTAMQTDRIMTLPKILCAVVGRNIIHNGLATMIMSPVDYPVECMSDVDVTFNEDVNNTDHGYTLFGVINYRSSGQDTGHYTAICKSNETDDWFDYNDENVQKSQFRKKNGGPKKSPYQRLVSILFYEKSEPLELKEVISTQNQTSMICMQSSTTSINTMSIDDMKIAALKDNDSMSTLSSNYDAPSAASVDCLSTFEQWNIS